MKKLLIFEQGARTPIIPVPDLLIFAKGDVLSLILGGGDPVNVLVRLSSFERGGGLCPSFPVQQLGAAAQYLAPLKGNSGRAKTYRGSSQEYASPAIPRNPLRIFSAFSETIFLDKPPFSPQIALKNLP